MKDRTTGWHRRQAAQLAMADDFNNGRKEEEELMGAEEDPETTYAVEGENLVMTCSQCGRFYDQGVTKNPVGFENVVRNQTVVHLRDRHRKPSGVPYAVWQAYGAAEVMKDVDGVYVRLSFDRSNSLKFNYAEWDAFLSGARKDFSR